MSSIPILFQGLQLTIPDHSEVIIDCFLDIFYSNFNLGFEENLRVSKALIEDFPVFCTTY